MYFHPATTYGITSHVEESTGFEPVDRLLPDHLFSKEAL